jgi:hypothetical protein
MKNFISTVYVKPNSVSEEKICVGLFVSNPEKTFFAYSNSKLRLINGLVPLEVYHSINKTLKTLHSNIVEKNEGKRSPEMFPANVFSPEYFSYLNKYNKGLVYFSEPSTAAKSINEMEFEKLFAIYVGDELGHEKPAIAKKTMRKIVSEYLGREVFKMKADINYAIDNNVAQSIYTDSKVDFISCNGNIFAGKSIDFNKEAKTIESHLFEYRVLVEGLMAFAAKRKLVGVPKFVAYFNTPINREGKEILDRAVKDKSKNFGLNEVDELEKAERILNAHPYRKFSEII